MDSPFSSQVSQPNLPQIFRHEDYSSMQIFTEAGGIQNRPHLMRKLRSHGATICNDPKSAEIILVHPHTSQGRHFIRDWGNDESKVVLEYTWANKSIEAGKALLEDDDYGDCIAQDDGGPIGDDEEEIISKSPLPTPRITPTERKRSTPKVPDPAPKSFGPPTKRYIQSPPAPSASTPTPSSSSTADMLPPTATMSQPSNAFNAMMAMTPSQFPVQMAAAAMMNPMLMQQMFAAMMMSQHGVQYNDEFKLALGDIMKFSPMQPPAYSQPPQMPTPVEDQTMSFGAGPSNLSHRSRNSVGESPEPMPANIVDKKGKQRAAFPPTKRRKISSPSHSGTPQAKSVPVQSSNSQIGNPEQSIFVKYKRPLSFFIQIDLHNRSTVVNSIRKCGGKIEKDMDLADYVILYQPHKKSKTFNDLLKTAQLSGKTTVPSRYIHDCVEQSKLLPTLDYEFDSAVPGKRKRQSSAVVESEDSDHEAAEKEQKRLAKNQREAERRKRLKMAEEAAKLRSSTNQATPCKEVKQAIEARVSTPNKTNPQAEGQNGFTASVAESTITGRHTPPIPKEHTRQPFGLGYKFSAAETEFALEYAQVLIERDHTISATAIASKIYKKLPHHTLKSWRTHLGKITANDLDIWRKRATIAYRKAQRQSQSGPSAPPEPPAPSVPPEGPIDIQFSSSPVADEVTQVAVDDAGSDPDFTFPEDLSPEEIKLLEEDDLNVISTFFANVDEKEPESSVWARLIAEHRCYTASTWQKFYSKHFEEVQARHAEILENAMTT